ncbi:MAG: hypothetical protein IPK00_07695 [Deltaproteobacteria bacterium]|nr:hypothetical protein [Deltaproteobacteria bacterium]
MEFLRELEVGALDDLRIGADRDAEQLVIGPREGELELEDPALDVAVDVEGRIEELRIDRSGGHRDARDARRVRRYARRRGRARVRRAGSCRPRLRCTADDLEHTLGDPAIEAGIHLLRRNAADLAEESPHRPPVDAREQKALGRRQAQPLRVLTRGDGDDVFQPVALLRRLRHLRLACTGKADSMPRACVCPSFFGRLGRKLRKLWSEGRDSARKSAHGGCGDPGAS